MSFKQSFGHTPVRLTYKCEKCLAAIEQIVTIGPNEGETSPLTHEAILKVVSHWTSHHCAGQSCFAENGIRQYPAMAGVARLQAVEFVESWRASE